MDSTQGSGTPQTNYTPVTVAEARSLGVTGDTVTLWTDGRGVTWALHDREKVRWPVVGGIR